MSVSAWHGWINTPARALLAVHGCVVLWGATAVIGKLISLRATDLVFWRMLVATLVLAALVRWVRLPARTALLVAITGVLLAIHWALFYATVKLASASLAVLCMSFASIWTVLLGPVLSRTPIRLAELGIAAAVLPGMALVLGVSVGPAPMAVLCGLLSALAIGAFAVLTKRLLATVEPASLCLLQMASGVAALTLYIAASGGWPALPDLRDGLLVLVFATLFTVLPFVVATYALRQISAFTAQFAINLEPVYGLLLAALVLGEAGLLSLTFYIGGALVLAAVIVQPQLSARLAVPEPQH